MAEPFYKPKPGEPASSSVVRMERRKAQRYSFTAAVEAIEPKTGTRIAGRTSDLGQGGCYVDTISPFPVGTSVKLRLTQGGKTFDAQAVVVYAHIGMGMGLAFTEAAPDQVRVLQRWLSELSGNTAEYSNAPHPEAAAVEPELAHIERRVLNQLITLMVKKRLLTEAEGAALLRELFS